MKDKEVPIQFALGVMGSLLAPYMIFHTLVDCKPFKMVEMAPKFSRIGYIVMTFSLILCFALTLALLRYLRSIAISVFLTVASPITAWVLYRLLLGFYSIELSATKPPGDFSLHAGLEHEMAARVLDATSFSLAFVIPASVGIAVIFAIRRRAIDASSHPDT